ncbi:hypothetical protein JQK87_01695 [Streptomyces sp. G44]|uniref:hypothetical protein n=1 Tax=Streptomyces sp. G44 TaxID=2807632 RepID=UPI00195FE9EF|nr:hypothetical protein [Streptomyces sp. G44]MBM7167155.1 hypothetical protein [Streptomyces sp. G44]
MTHPLTPAPLRGTAARRALLHAAALLFLASITPMVNAALQLGALYDVRWPQRTSHYTALIRIGVGVVVFFWLLWTVIARTTLDRVSARQRILQRCAALGCSSASLYATDPDRPLGHFGTVVTGLSFAWLAWEVCRSHGITLEKTPREKNPQRWCAQTFDLAGRAFGACMAGGCLAYLGVQALLHLDVAALPVMAGNQLDTIGVTGPLDFMAQLVVVVAVEDVVIVAATAALMTAAGRPAWQIYTTVCAVEVVVHAYFGAPAIAMALFAVGRLQLYTRSGRVLPLIIGHASFDLLGALLMPLPLTHRLLIAIPVGLAASVIAERVRRAAAPSPEPVTGAAT